MLYILWIKKMGELYLARDFVFFFIVILNNTNNLNNYFVIHGLYTDMYFSILWLNVYKNILYNVS